MKRRGILNAQLSELIAMLGHTDQLVVADCGLPVPPEVPVVDLALVAGIPAFADVIRALAEEIVVQRLTVAEEIVHHNQAALDAVRAAFPDVPLDRIPHEALKHELPRVRAVVRTGEATPYANAILECGVAF
ncbi:MAG TPA: D-ribose pyranase [Trueperaceae bacterium]|nr:D-ribose pyranase [Trueperaceae bacterium]